jgi:hypothetical protein
MQNVSVPKSVQHAAKKGLELHKEHGRGGTDVGVKMAQKLASGDDLSRDDVRHIAQYFPRHSVDNLSQDGQDGGEVSNGYIAWMLWGGDAGRKWSEGVVDDLKEDDRG